MKKPLLLVLLAVVLLFNLCTIDNSAERIILKVTQNIDTINNVYYKQNMVRTNPNNINQKISRYREMFFERLIPDSIVGVKGRWYFYDSSGTKVLYEDIYDGKVLIRKNNVDSLIKKYDLVKYPKFKEKHFWSHNTPFSLRYMLLSALKDKRHFKISKLQDTVLNNVDCFTVKIVLTDKTTMPGFQTYLEDSRGSVSITMLYIDKRNYYPLRVFNEFYSLDDPDTRIFIDQTYFDIEFNSSIIDSSLFNTSDKILTEFIIDHKKPL